MSITVKPNNTQIEQVHGFKKENANTIFSQGLYNAKGIPSSEHGYRGNQVTSFDEIIQKGNYTQDFKDKVKELSDQAIKDLPGIKGQSGEMLPKDWESYLVPKLKEIGMTYDQYKKIIEPTNFDSMFKAIQEKAKHDETYKKNIMELARKGIMPAEISQYDAFWGCGINGNGSNHLGILTHILGRQLLKEAGIKPEKELLDNGVDIDNLKEARQNLSKSYSQFISDKANQHTLSHDVAVKNVDQPIFSYSQKDIQNKKEADQSIREIVNEKLHTESNISTKGRLGETYKFAFKSEKEAQAMLDKLSELGIKTDETSCRALQGGEKYPMGDHKFIVRIEKHVEKNLGILLKNGFNLDDTTSNKLVENAYNNAPPAKSTHATFPPEHFNSSGNIKSTDASYHSGRPTPFPKLL